MADQNNQEQEALEGLQVSLMINYRLTVTGAQLGVILQALKHHKDLELRDRLLRMRDAQIRSFVEKTKYQPEPEKPEGES